MQPNGEPADVRELVAGHDCMITVPGALAEMLLDIGDVAAAQPPSPVGAGR